MSLLDRIRRVYYFGYGAERDPEAVHKIIGRRPKVIGPATIHDFELRVQNTHDNMRPVVKEILKRAWGTSFQSYAAIPKKGAKIHGTLYRMSLARRHEVDEWELIEEGWFKKQFVDAHLRTGKVVQAETQILAPGQSALQTANGSHYPTYLMPRTRFLRKAAHIQTLERHKDSIYKTSVYYFGYGAQSEPEMIQAIIGARPKVIGPATLKGYELRIQHIEDMYNEGAQEVLIYAWGPHFRVYTIIPHEHHTVTGTLYKIALHRRHMIDKWMLVHDGWHERTPIIVELPSGQKVHAQTQVLSSIEAITRPVHTKHSVWLMPRKQMLKKADDLRAILD